MLGKTYFSTISTHTESTVYCDCDLCGADFFGLFVYFSWDCTEPCMSSAYYYTNNGVETANASCYGVAFRVDCHKSPEDLCSD